MDVIQIPFNKEVGILKSDDSNYLLMIKETDTNINHLNTLHASVLFALAEASSGQYLTENFSDITNLIIPVLRRAEVKYCKPAKGKVYSKATLLEYNRNRIYEDIKTRRKCSVTVEVELHNSNREKIMKAKYEWFIMNKE